MLTLTPQDITAITEALIGPLADAVAARLRGDIKRSTEQPDYDAARFRRLFEIRQMGLEVGRASKGQGKIKTGQGAKKK